jgi:hypothetical protein
MDKNPHPPVLEYATDGGSLRRPQTLPDVLYLALAVGCYMLVFYADAIMPGGANWNFAWEWASFLMTIAAQSSIVLFVAGLVCVLAVGRKRVALVILIGTWITGPLPVLMVFIARRWLQQNFA